MSSRSLAAARARRTGENQPTVSGNRPGTSINSHAAFVPQMPTNNVRMAKPPINNQNQVYNQPPPSQQYLSQQSQQSQAPSQNKLPFSKLSVSDAVGLITLRLGRVEQWIIETEHDKTDNGGSMNLPENSKVIDNSVFTNIISRLDSLEKTSNSKTPQNIDAITEEISSIKEQVTKISDVTTSHNLSVAKNAQQMLKLERDVTETKDILKTFMIKYDNFVNELSEKFTDYECAIAELEKNITIETEDVLDPSKIEVNVSLSLQEKEEGEVVDDEPDDLEDDLNLPYVPSSSDEKDIPDNLFIPVNLKEILKQELSEIN